MDSETQKSDENDGVVRIGKDRLKRWEDLTKCYEKYTDLYNDLASKDKKIEAVSHLSNVREELRRLSEKVKRKVNHQVKIYRNFFQVDKSDSEEVHEIYEQICEQIDKAFPFSVNGNPLGISEDRLTELAFNFCELKGCSRSLEIEWFTDKSDSYKDNLGGLPYTGSIDGFTYTIYRNKEELEDYFLHLEAVESIIETAIFANYPDELNKSIVEEKTSNKKPGPKTPDELLDDIKSVLEIIKDEESTLYDEEIESGLTDEDGELIIKRVVDYVEDYVPFAKRWIGEDASLKEGGYSKRTLKKHFGNVYKDEEF